MKSKKSKFNFLPSVGILVVDPILKVKKSESFAVADGVDDPHLGVVMAVGDPKPYESNPIEFLKSPAKVGDKILYSIVGIEKIRIPHGDDLRKEFVIVPFIRVLGILKK